MNSIDLLKSNEICGADYEISGNKYHIGTVKISPDMAYMLLHNNKNRNIKKANLQKIAQSIGAEGWDVGISMIVFTDSGRLIDGQHRLIACKSTNTPIISIYSVVPDTEFAMRSIDRGAKRSLADDLRLAGAPNSGILSTVIRAVYSYYQNVTPEVYFASEKYRSVVTDADYNRFYNEHRSEIDTIAAYTQKFYRNLRKNTASVMGPRVVAFLFTALYNVASEEAVNFFSALSGAKVASCPDSIMQLRQRFIELERMTSTPSTRVVAAYVIKTWNAYISGETLTQLTFRGGGAHPEKFPKVKGVLD